MAIYLKKFETQAAYEAAQSGLILPNVSLTVDNNTVHYNPSSPTPPTPTHDYVEIGGVKWATMNVGANSVTDTGLYFQWGDTQGYTASQVGSGEGQKAFTWADYKYSDGGSSPSNMTKYNSTDGKTELDLEDDAVRANWGGNWRMPTKDELSALITGYTTTQTQNYKGTGVPAVVVTDGTNEVVFPYTGYADNGQIKNGVSNWTSWLVPEYTVYSFCLNGENVAVNNRCFGCAIRGVLDE